MVDLLAFCRNFGTENFRSYFVHFTLIVCNQKSLVDWCLVRCWIRVSRECWKGELLKTLFGGYFWVFIGESPQQILSFLLIPSQLAMWILVGAYKAWPEHPVHHRKTLLCCWSILQHRLQTLLCSFPAWTAVNGTSCSQPSAFCLSTAAAMQSYYGPGEKIHAVFLYSQKFSLY